MLTLLKTAPKRQHSYQTPLCCRLKPTNSINGLAASGSGGAPAPKDPLRESRTQEMSAKPQRSESIRCGLGPSKYAGHRGRAQVRDLALNKRETITERGEGDSKS